MSKQKNDINNLNYFVSQSIIKDCREVIENINEKKELAKEDKEIQITQLDVESLDLAVKQLKEVAQRQKLCKTDNKHYWIIDSNLHPETAYCHWCDLSVNEYSKQERKK